MNEEALPVPDIRVGDLIKATSKHDPEEHSVFRVVAVKGEWVDGERRIAHRDHHTFEVLDRPLPPIDEELLEGAINVYRQAEYGFEPRNPLDPSDLKTYGPRVEPVINFVREYDRKNNTKENA